MGGQVAFVVLVHKQPEQVRRLVTRLRPGPIFVHVDARSPTSVTGPLQEMEAAGEIRLLPRFRSGWASWGLVEATLEGLAQALEEPTWSHLMVISGQDYPLWPVQAITDLMAGEFERSWLHQAQIPVAPPRIGDPDGGMGRITKWHLTIRGRHFRVPLRRSLPSGLIPHYGQQQCSLAAPLVRLIVDEVRRRPELRQYFRRTQAPDELLIPTVAMSSPFAELVSDDNIWYADWSAGGAHPKVLGLDDFDRLAQEARAGGDTGGPSPVKCFARKFDQFRSASLLDRIDEELLGVTLRR